MLTQERRLRIATRRLNRRESVKSAIGECALCRYAAVATTSRRRKEVREGEAGAPPASLYAP